MNDKILDELRLNFQDLEKEILGIVCAAGLSTITFMTEKLDDELSEKETRKDIDTNSKQKDKKRYRYKFKTKRQYKQ